MFVPEEEIQQVTIVSMRESIGEDFFQVGGGVSLNIIIMWGGGVEINFCLMRGGYDLVLGHISPISQPPLQVIIAQSLTVTSSTKLCFCQKYQGSLKIPEYSVHQMTRLGRLKIHIYDVNF